MGRTLVGTGSAVVAAEPFGVVLGGAVVGAEVVGGVPVSPDCVVVVDVVVVDVVVVGSGAGPQGGTAAVTVIVVVVAGNGAFERIKKRTTAPDSPGGVVNDCSSGPSEDWFPTALVTVCR